MFLKVIIKLLIGCHTIDLDAETIITKCQSSKQIRKHTTSKYLGGAAILFARSSSLKSSRSGMTGISKEK
jgi:hypothetical protein